ncbi:hypothetical protein LA345_38835 (plasmid) [Burkholderia vietnamiensis]|nr:hypothetical protein [Burkholderia vietnamiensis]
MIASSHPNAIAMYREETSKSTVYTHKRRRCGCGKVATAIDLKRYGKCARCIREIAKPKS